MPTELPASPVSLTLAPHSRLRMDLRLGRVGSLSQALSNDPDLFARSINTEAGPRLVGEFLFQEAILSCPSPANQALVSYLLAHGACFPASFPGAIGFAMSIPDISVVRQLEKAGWTPDMVHPGGKTALAWASAFAMREVLQSWKSYLPLAPDETGSNLLHELCSQSMWSSGGDSVLPCAQVLIRSGVDWEHRNNAGKLPADLCSYPQIVQDIDNFWRRHKSRHIRKALGQISSSVCPTPQTLGKVVPRM